MGSRHEDLRCSLSFLSDYRLFRIFVSDYRVSESCTVLVSYLIIEFLRILSWRLSFLAAGELPLWAASEDPSLLYLLRLSREWSSCWRGHIVQACRRTLQALGGVIIVLANGRKQRSWLCKIQSSFYDEHSVSQVKFSETSRVNPTNCRPVVKDLTPKENISHDDLLLNSKKGPSGGACANSNLGSQRELCYLHPFNYQVIWPWHNHLIIRWSVIVLCENVYKTWSTNQTNQSKPRGVAKRSRLNVF